VINRYLDQKPAWKPCGDPSLRTQCAKIRRLLGFDTIDYVGYSGGTWLGAYYQTYFPEHVGRFVLDSNTDFTRPWSETFAAQPEAFERRFREDFAPWAAKYDAQLQLGRSPRLVLRAYEKLRAALKKQPAVEEFLDGSVKISYDQNTLDSIVSTDLYSKLDFPSLAADLAFLRDLSATQSTSGARAAQRKVDALPVARQLQLARRAQQATRRTLGVAPLGQPFADDAENATFIAVTCNDTEWPRAANTATGCLHSSGQTIHCSAGV
jgi:pimeloyl-ACP methyl ester carboxylesterase